MTPRSAALEQEGKCRPLPRGTHFLQGQAPLPGGDPSGQGRTAPQAAITVAGVPHSGSGYVGP